MRLIKILLLINQISNSKVDERKEFKQIYDNKDKIIYTGKT